MSHLDESQQVQQPALTMLAVRYWPSADMAFRTANVRFWW